VAAVAMHPDPGPGAAEGALDDGTPTLSEAIPRPVPAGPDGVVNHGAGASEPPRARLSSGTPAAAASAAYAWPDPVPNRGSTALWMGAAGLGALAIAATIAVIAQVPSGPVPATSAPSPA